MRLRPRRRRAKAGSSDVRPRWRTKSVDWNGDVNSLRQRGTVLRALEYALSRLNSRLNVLI